MKGICLGLSALLVAAATMGCGDDDPASTGGTTGGSGGTGNGGAGAGGAGDGEGGEGGEGGAFHDPATGAWEQGFGLPGLSGFAARASSLVEGPDGRVYVGGIFQEAAGTAASNVAAWDGDDWEAVGNGLPGWVKALTFGADGALYAGGSFATDTTSNQLARWDGTAWTLLPGDVEGDIDTLATQDDRILVAGSFSDVDGLGTAGVAAWDLIAGWSAIGTSGTDWEAKAIVVTDDVSFCIGGSFSEVDGVPAANAACWDGGAWSQLGDGLPGVVEDLARAPDGSFFAGGSFAFVDGSTGEYEAGIARLVGSTWEAFVRGVYCLRTSGDVRSPPSLPVFCALHVRPDEPARSHDVVGRRPGPGLSRIERRSYFLSGASGYEKRHQRNLPSKKEMGPRWPTRAGVPAVTSFGVRPA